jgi:hypothetical protein
MSTSCSRRLGSGAAGAALRSTMTPARRASAAAQANRGDRHLELHDQDVRLADRRAAPLHLALGERRVGSGGHDDRGCRRADRS